MTRKLHLDEGHWGHDSGAVGKFVEVRENVEVANAVEAAAVRQGWKVFRTSDRRDLDVQLSERYKMANAEKADAFVSIHHNDARVKGEETIYPNSNDGREVASRRLADFINDEISEVTPENSDRGIYADRRGLAVLKGTDMPAVIVEVTGVSDPVLGSPAFSVKVGEAIVRGICEWYGDKFVEPGGKAVAPKKRIVKAAPVAKKHRVLGLGDSGEDVESLQRYLIRKGYSCGRAGADGIFGRLTRSAVRAYQRKRLPRYIGGVHQWDGIVGPRTWGLIDAGK